MTHADALVSLRRAVDHFSDPLVARLVRFPPRRSRDAQLRTVGWLSLMLGAPRPGLDLLGTAGGIGDHVLRHDVEAAVEGLLSGDRGPAAALDERLTLRNAESRPPHDLGEQAVARYLRRIAADSHGSLPHDSLLTSARLSAAFAGAFAADAGIDVAHVVALAELQLAAAREPLVTHEAHIDPDGDGMSLGAQLRRLAERAGISWRRASSQPSRRLASWTFGDWHDLPLADDARSWQWVMRTTDGFDAPIAHGIERLRPVRQLAAFADLHYYEQTAWPDGLKAPVGDSVVVGDGPGRLLLLPRTAGPRDPDTGDCPVWVFDEASHELVHRACSLWRLLRDVG